MQDLLAFLPIIGIALLFWLLVVRPASKRQQQLRSVQNSLTAGDRVIIAAGLHGTVRSVADTTIGLEVADGVVVTAARGSVVEVVTAQPEGSV